MLLSNCSSGHASRQRSGPCFRRASAQPCRALQPLQATASTRRAADVQQVVALKEWAVTCAALGDGSQTILLRKGGIREPTFKPQAKNFLLFPTVFHTQEPLLKPGAAGRYQEELHTDPKTLSHIPIKYWAQVTGAWTTSSPEVLHALDELHIWSDAFLDARLKWRRNTPLTLMELRCYKLPGPYLLPASEELWGCFSWLELPGLALQQSQQQMQEQQQIQQQQQQVGGNIAVVKLPVGTPALSDEQFAAKQEYLLSKLAELQAVPVAVE